MEAKFIVIYGANNIGKSTQTKAISRYLINQGKQVLKIKYPIYDLKPTGPLINKILRHPESLDKNYNDTELQQLYAQNRKDFQPLLTKILHAGIYVIAEDYTGTGIAWGLTKGVSLRMLERLNKDLILPDLCILLNGNRFTKKIEKFHRFEDSGHTIWEKARINHLLLAEKYNWHVINANQEKSVIAKEIIKKFNLQQI